MNLGHSSNLEWFDSNVNALEIIIGSQFNLTIVRFVKKTRFMQMNCELPYRSSDWAAEHFTDGSVSNDVTFMIVFCSAKQ